MITQDLRDDISKLSPEMQIKAWQQHWEINPFDLIREGLLYIKTDRQKIIPLIPNPVQSKLLDYIEMKWIQNKPCFITVPKARRTGISTIIEAITYVLTGQLDNTNAIIVANKLVNSDNIFAMTKLYHEKLYYEFQPKTKRSNKKELSFSERHSNIIIDSAENKDVGQSWAFQIIHLSEVAYFGNPEKITTGLFQTLPDNMFVLVVLESTGNGVGGYFYDMVKGSSDGTSDYKLFFFAWHDKLENTMYIPEGVDFELDSEGKYGNEISIKNTYNLTDEQMYWRRYTIKNKCNNNLKTFLQEHPANLDECFQASGVNAFDVEKLNEREKSTRPYNFRGILEDEGGIIKFREDVNGWLDIWEKPVSGWNNRYNIPLDTGGVWYRTEKDCADWSVAIVDDRITKQDVASFHLHAPAHIIAKRTILLARYYDGAQISPEINKWINETDDQGEPVLNILRDNYANIYRRKVYDASQKKWLDKIGFHTNKQTKKLIIDAIREDLNEYKEVGRRINDIEIIKEQKMYVTNDVSGTYEATAGEKDDRVMAQGIGLVTSAEMMQPSMKQKVDINLNESRYDTGSYV